MMASEYTILGPDFKFIVRSVNAEITGLYDERDSTLTRPDCTDIAQLIPYKYRKAFARTTGRFWHHDRARVTIEGKTTHCPYLPLYGYRGRHLVTLYAIAN